MVCTPWAAVLGSRTRVDPYNRSITKPLTGEPDAGDPPVRFGGRGKVQSLVPTPIAKDSRMRPSRARLGRGSPGLSGRLGFGILGSRRIQAVANRRLHRPSARL